jgi:hypothetical protein
MTVVVFLAAALLCIGDDCQPALVGKDTDVGQFPIVRRYVQARGYGGDVMQFADTPQGLLAVHCIWLGKPCEHRAERLASGDAGQRRNVTNGCINVLPDVYERLVTARTLEIRP